MKNKYYIVNPNESKFCIDYLFYIIFLIFVIYLILNLTNNYENENFEEVNANISLNKDELYKQCTLNNNFILNKNKELEKKNKQQERSIIINNNYNKIDNDFNNDLFYKYFEDITLPQLNLNNKVLVNSEVDLNKIKSEMRNFKNIYKVGDIINKSSSENISSDDICYKDFDMNIKSNQDLKNKYTNCMACSINSSENYLNDNSWKKTKTNIKDICLYNVNSEDNSLIPNYNKCKQLCGV